MKNCSRNFLYILYFTALVTCTVNAQPLEVILTGLDNGWVSPEGLTLFSEVYSAQEIEYSIALDNPQEFSVLNSFEEKLLLPSQENTGYFLFLRINSEIIHTESFGIDFTSPIIEVSLDGNNFSYIIRDANIDLNNCYYTLSHSEIPEFNHSKTRFIGLQNTIKNSSNYKYFHIYLSDFAGNTSEQTYIVNVKELIKFSQSMLDDSVTLEVDPQIDLERSTYHIKNEATTYEVRQLESHNFTVNFPTSGKYEVTVNVVTLAGNTFTINSPLYSVNFVDKSAPSITLTPTEQGLLVQVKDLGSGVDESKTSVESLGKKHNFKYQSLIQYDFPIVEFIRIIATDLAGNTTSQIVLNHSVQSLSKFDLHYDNGFYVFAEGYYPHSNMSLDSDNLYYVVKEEGLMPFSNIDGETINFYVNFSLIPDFKVKFDTSSAHKITWKSDISLENGYYTLANNAEKFTLPQNNSLNKFDLDGQLLNQITISVPNNTQYRSRYFRVNIDLKEQLRLNLNQIKTLTTDLLLILSAM